MELKAEDSKFVYSIFEGASYLEQATLQNNKAIRVSMEFGNNYLSVSQYNNNLHEIICINNVVKCCQTEMKHKNTSVMTNYG